MKTNLTKRAMVSFDGACPLKCAHCFTCELPECNEATKKTIDEIISDLSNEFFDIIYVSHTYENFFNENKGIELCEKLYNRYEKDIFIITRMTLKNDTIDSLGFLNHKMQEKGKQLFYAVSCMADDSYTISEKAETCPSPSERLSGLKRIYETDIPTLLILRPVFPESIVKTDEYLRLIEKAKDYIDAVVSSGLIATDQIFKKLNLNKSEFRYMDGDSDYIDNMPRENAYFLNVEKELKIIKNYCDECGVPFFRHSMPALNHIASMRSAEGDF